MSYFKIAEFEFFLDDVARGVIGEGIAEVIFLCLIQDMREVEVKKELEELEPKDIEQVIALYVKEVNTRPMWVDGCLAIPTGYTHWFFPEKPEKFFRIVILDTLDEEECLITFIHEILHIFFRREQVHFPNEDEIDRVAKLLVTKHRTEIGMLLKKVVRP